MDDNFAFVNSSSVKRKADKKSIGSLEAKREI